MADQSDTQDVLLDVRVAEASWLYKFYLNQEKKILGTASVVLFLTIWELVGNTFQLINPMFMSAPSLIWNAAVQLFVSGEIYNDLYVSGIELFWGYFLSVAFAIPFGIMIGWYKKIAYIFDPFVNAMNATPRVALLPLVIIWLGIGILSKVGIIFLGAVFPILTRCGLTITGAISVMSGSLSQFMSWNKVTAIRRFIAVWLQNMLMLIGRSPNIFLSITAI